DLELSGSGGCHLALGRDRSTLVVSDYGSGTVETVRLDADGLPVELIDVDDHHDHADGLDPHTPGRRSARHRPPGCPGPGAGPRAPVSPGAVGQPRTGRGDPRAARQRPSASGRGPR